MIDYTKKLTTAEVMNLSPEEKHEYIENRKAYRRWRKRRLNEQTLWGLGITIACIVVPSGFSVIGIPLGLWTVYRAMKRDIVFFYYGVEG